MMTISFFPAPEEKEKKVANLMRVGFIEEILSFKERDVEMFAFYSPLFFSLFSVFLFDCF